MKKLGVVLLSFLLLIGMFPQSVIAAQSTNFEQELTQYLSKVSAERGFNVTKEDIEASLANNEETIDNFESVEDLSNYLGDVINANLSNIDYIYQENELDEVKLKELLSENGDDINDYIFIYDLDTAVYFYKDGGVLERDPNFDNDLIEYLTAISKERGFEVTKEDVEASLALYESTMEDFETVEDLSDYLGAVIKADLSNLDYYSFYGLDKQSILQLLEKNGKDINDFIYIDDLGEVIDSSYDGAYPVFDESQMEELLPMLLAELDLTQEELQRLEAHFTSLEENFSNPELLAQAEELGNRVMALASSIESDELTDEQAAELLSIYQEMLTLAHLEINYNLIKVDGSVTPISPTDLIKLKELKNTNLKISVYDSGSQFLADFIIKGEIIEKAAEDVVTTVEQPSKVKSVKQNQSKYQTVKGGELPKTASAYIPNTLIGLFIISVGIFLYRKVKNNDGQQADSSYVYKDGGKAVTPYVNNTSCSRQSANVNEEGGLIEK